jgi:ClpP class serine protease
MEGSVKKAFDWASSQVWAMTEEALRGVLEIAARENLPIEAVEAKLGRPLDNAQTTTVRDGIAIIPISGPIFPKANLMTEVSGATSVQIAARDFNTALSDPNIKGIILNVDSPGGNIVGIHEFAQMIYAARETDEKPIKTYTGGIMASAAYAIGSASSEVIVDRTATLGSLGVVTSMPDPSKRSSKDVEIVSSQSPKKRVDVSTEAGRASIQQRVNEQADILLDYVAKQRGVSVDDLLAIEGDVRVGESAVKAKLADRVGSLESVIKEMSAAAAVAKEKKMNGTFMSRLRAVLPGGTVAVEPVDNKATEDPTEAELSAALKEIETLRDKAAKADELLAREREQAEAKLKAEREARVAAETETFMKTHGDKLGQNAYRLLEGAYRGAHLGTVSIRREKANAAKDATEEDRYETISAAISPEASEVLVAMLDGFAAALPPIGAPERVKAGGAEVDEKAKIAGGDKANDPMAAHNETLKRLEKAGVKQGTAAWSDEYMKMLATVEKELGVTRAA